MSLVTIAWKSIRQRMLASSMTALSVALGVMLMVSVLVIHGIMNRVFSQRSIGYHLIVGPKGSDLQLVLNTVYRIWQPIENLPYLYYLELKKDPRVEYAVPFCLGDVTEQGFFPIVGTDPVYFELEYAPGQKFRMKRANYEQTDFKTFDAIIGSHVARENKWDLGSKLKLVHGGAESDHKHDEEFTVVGVLAPTGTANDKTVFINLDGFYAISGHEKPAEEALDSLKKCFPQDPAIQNLTLEDVAGEHAHEHEAEHGEGESGRHHHGPVTDYMKEVTAILVRTKGSFASINLRSEINTGFQAQAVNPILAMSRLMNTFVGGIQKVLLFLTAMIVVVSGVGIFVSIYNSMADRRRDIAVMRALGARRVTVFAIILTESVLLCFGGGILGVLLGHGMVLAAGPLIEAQSGLLVDPLTFVSIGESIPGDLIGWLSPLIGARAFDFIRSIPAESILIPVLIVLASLVGFVPGLTAYRTDVAKTLNA